jgi:hypothetical protein
MIGLGEVKRYDGFRRHLGRDSKIWFAAIGRRLRLTILDEESNVEKIEPNKKMLEIMNAAKRKQAKMRFTDGSKTQQILRKARNGGMFE